MRLSASATIRGRSYSYIAANPLKTRLEGSLLVTPLTPGSLYLAGARLNYLEAGATSRFDKLAAGPHEAELR